MRRSRRVAVHGAVVLWALIVPAAAPAQGSPGDLAGARERAKGLVAQMTLDEKIIQVHGEHLFTGNGFTGHTPAIERLGIPDWFLADGPNGVGNGATGVTAFPAAISSAAT